MGFALYLLKSVRPCPAKRNDLGQVLSRVKIQVRSSYLAPNLRERTPACTEADKQLQGPKSSSFGLQLDRCGTHDLNFGAFIERKLGTMGGHPVEQLTCGILPTPNRSGGPITKNQAAALLKDFEIRPLVVHPTSDPARSPRLL